MNPAGKARAPRSCAHPMNHPQLHGPGRDAMHTPNALVPQPKRALAADTPARSEPALRTSRPAGRRQPDSPRQATPFSCPIRRNNLASHRIWQDNDDKE
jgi:hypothetical protein